VKKLATRKQQAPAPTSRPELKGTP
jgi:hypothetical protein